MPTRAAILCVTLLGLAALGQADDADSLRIEPVERWSDVFGDKEVVLHFRVKSPKAFKGRATWTLAADNRTLMRGESAVAADAEKRGEVVVRLAIPPVKDGVVFGVRLQLQLLDEQKVVARHVKPLWIFPANAFAAQTEWLKGLKITLFDPDKRTANVLRKSGVPFEQTHNVAAFADLKEGTLIIGEGVSFKDYADLSEAMAAAAARGRSVLCLAPAAGFLPVPGSRSQRGTRPTRLDWRRADIITELDKRLDAEAWFGDARPVRSHLALKAEEGTVVAEVSAEAEDWAWLEVDHGTSHGRLIVSGLNIIDAWDSGPAPRFLLARILDRVTRVHERAPATDKEGKP